ncbi:MAG: methyltransferase domain-containing protein [Deltaproteobacteria bacterium]|nr:methyltransferase domain-containing protein [Deltaproteobacteria bacterium]
MNQRYNKKASRFIIDNLEIIPKGRLLDIAMGSGRNAIYLAKMGYEVEGIDISASALDNARALAGENGVRIKTYQADLEKENIIEKCGYDVIICFNYLQRSLIPSIKDGLRQGGMVVYETFIIDQLQFGRPNNPDYLLGHNELLHIFNDFRCLRYREGIIENRKAIAGIMALK